MTHGKMTTHKDTWLRDEPWGWVATTGFMGAYTGLMFGFNAWRAAGDGHWYAVVVLMVGTAVGGFCAVSALIETAGRLKRDKTGRKMGRFGG